MQHKINPDRTITLTRLPKVSGSVVLRDLTVLEWISAWSGVEGGATLRACHQTASIVQDWNGQGEVLPQQLYAQLELHTAIRKIVIFVNQQLVLPVSGAKPIANPDYSLTIDHVPVFESVKIKPISILLWEEAKEMIASAADLKEGQCKAIASILQSPKFTAEELMSDRDLHAGVAAIWSALELYFRTEATDDESEESVQDDLVLERRELPRLEILAG